MNDERSSPAPRVEVRPCPICSTSSRSPSSHRGTACTRPTDCRRGDSPERVLDRPGGAGRTRRARQGVRCCARAPAAAIARAAASGIRRDRVDRSGISGRADGDRRSAAGAVDARRSGGAQRALRSRLSDRARRRRTVSPSPTQLAERSRGVRSGRRQRPGARRRLGGASRRADGGGATVAVLGSGVDVIYPPRARGAGARDRDERRRRQRARAGHAAAADVLPAAQPHHQRAVARGRRRRGGREERLADHGALRARAGTRRAGGARQRVERPQSRRARAAARRRKDCGVGGRYPGRAWDGDGGTFPRSRASCASRESRPGPRVSDARGSRAISMRFPSDRA